MPNPDATTFIRGFKLLVDPPSKSLLLRVKDSSTIRAAIPKCKLINIQGHNLAVHHGIDEVKVLRNIGIEAPSPILHHYKWPGRYVPFAHQKDTSAMLTLNKRAFVLNETGTGKSKSALWAADYLMNIGQVHKCLIVAPLSTLERVWMEEVFSTLMHRNAVVLHGNKERRVQRLESDVAFYIINHDGLAVMKKELKARKDIDLIICDEYATYRNGATTKFKVLREILTPEIQMWGMTATPCPNAPTDAWALTRLISPERVPEHFGTFKRETMIQVSQYKWVPKHESYDIAFSAMQPAVRYRKADCLDLPPVVTEERDCGTTPEQQKAYDRMRIDMVAQAAIGIQVSAVNAADQISKLRQILCGVIKNGDEYITLPHGPRLEVLLECIQEAAAKVIVVVPFKGILRVLEEEVSAHYTCAVLNGDVSPNNRNKIITAFKADKDPHVLLCHPQVMAHGLNLTEADVCIFYAPIYSNDQFQQVVERFNRPGQTRKMTVIRIGGNKLEWDIYEMLDKKQDNQATILDMYKRIVS